MSLLLVKTNRLQLLAKKLLFKLREPKRGQFIEKLKILHKEKVITYKVRPISASHANGK